MHLQSVDTNKIHISYFHHYVSAYVTNYEMVKKLTELIEEGIKTAQASLTPVVIEQDNIEHVFIAFPSGELGLYRKVGLYQVIKNG